ncbi:MAG: CHASE3 domain-containing protein [Armatimonadetes bacterium]|nr:CHASE3 domain-containing protein [Armatimonadota bacterium]
MNSLHRRHLYIAFLLLFTLTVNAGIAYFNIRRLVQNERVVARTYLILTEVENVLSLATEAETTQRGFILTGSARDLQAFEAAQSQIAAALSILSKNIVNPEQKRNFPLLRRAVEQRLKLARQGIELRRKRGFGAAQKFIAAGAGGREMEAIQTYARRIQNSEQEILQQRADESTEAAENATRTFWIATGANVVFLALVSALLWRASEQNARLEHAFADLKRAEGMRDSLSAMLVHDLRTPLTTLLGPLEMLHSGVLGPLDETQREIVMMSHLSGERLLTLVNELLDISKLEAGEMKIQAVAVALPDLIREAIGEVSRHQGGETARISTEIEADLPPINGDRDLLLRVLINLLGNALKFTPSSGQVAVGARSQDQMALLWVRDTGEGIPAQDVDKVFDKFGQVETRKAGRKMSTGLGLTFCKLAVESHGGRIWVESQVGQGSTFYFTVPLHREARAETAKG